MQTAAIISKAPLFDLLSIAPSPPPRSVSSEHQGGKLRKRFSAPAALMAVAAGLLEPQPGELE